MSILQLEENFSKRFIELSTELGTLFENIKTEKISLENNEISKAILLRLKYYFEYQYNVKKFLQKRYVASNADFFVETIAFYLKVVFEIYKIPFEVHSERKLERKRGSMRPDISIWRNDKVVAIIECKTQFGRNRENWEKDFSERDKKLKDIFPEALAFLVVMSSENWPGFGNNKNVGRKYFCLYNVWPNIVDTNKLSDYLLNPIESVIEQVIKKTEEVVT